jgi:hypothetical protein
MTKLHGLLRNDNLKITAAGVPLLADGTAYTG